MVSLPSPLRGGAGGGGLVAAAGLSELAGGIAARLREPPTPCPLPSWARGFALALLIASPAFADVVSKAPEAVTVTVYRDRPMTAAQLREQDHGASGLAMIAETRTVDLPAGRTRIAFQGVADAIIPASAALTGLPGKLVERNFDYDLLDPGSLIAASVGRGVTLRRINPKTGQVSEEPATLRSGPDGVVAQTSHGVEALGCGAGPQALVFDHLPAGQADRPTLSVIADAPRAGRYTLTLSYLTVQIDWSADYVAHLSRDGRTLDLTGWLTLSNRSNAGFADAPTSVVAGELSREAPDLPDIAPKAVQAECWPMGTTSDFRRYAPAARIPVAVSGYASGMAVTEIVVTAQKRQQSLEAVPVRATQSNLGDYKLYSLVEPTTLAARQTKQIRFLHQSRVTFDKLYVFDVNYVGELDAEVVKPALMALRFHNKTAEGLGLALPAGEVSVRQPQAIVGGDDLFIGDRGLRDVPVGEEFELSMAPAPDVEVKSRVISDDQSGPGERVALEFTVTNAKPQPVAFELRQNPAVADGFRIVSESKRHVMKNGADVWRVTLPANGSVTLSYAYVSGA